MLSKRERMIEVLRKYDNSLRKGMEYKRFFADEIPENVSKKLLTYFDNHLPINSIVGFYDTSTLRTTKAGIIFVCDGFYYRFMGKAYYFAYKDIGKMRSDSTNLLYLNTVGDEDKEYSIIESLDTTVLKEVLTELINVDKEYHQNSEKSSGRVKKLDLPKDMLNKCNGIIHGASAACGGVGTGLAQIPASDNAVIVPIQVGMIIALGAVFDLNITESGAKSIIASAGATIAGRTVSQFLVGWIPGLGNAINTATAAGITEAIGWIAVKNFYERWIEDKNKGRYEGMRQGYAEASDEYEGKMRMQAEEFIKQQKDFQKERDEYESLLDKYEEYIEKLEREHASEEVIEENKKIYHNLKNLK